MPVIKRLPMPTSRRKDGLLVHSRNVQSQCGEDGILEFIFSMILPPPVPETLRTCVEVGSWDGKHLSNSYNLLNRPAGLAGDAGVCAVGEWAGLLIEADAARSDEAAKFYAGRHAVRCITAMVGLDGNQSLDNLIRDHLPKESSDDIDFLSIDVDGEIHPPSLPLFLTASTNALHDAASADMTRHVPARLVSAERHPLLICVGIDYWIWEGLRLYRPKVVCIEFNPTIPYASLFSARDVVG